MGKTETDDDIFLSNRDLAERYGKPLATIRDWRIRRTGPRGIKIGGAVRYRLSEVKRWEREAEQAEAERRQPVSA